MSKLGITFQNLLEHIVEINSPKIDIDLIDSWLFILMSKKTFHLNIMNSNHGISHENVYDYLRPKFLKCGLVSPLYNKYDLIIRIVSLFLSDADLQ